MSKIEHTPGPWAAYSGGDSAASNPLQAWHITGPTRVYQDRSLGFIAADARLIAAAPQMLKALQNVRTAKQTGHNESEAWGWVDSAINEATRA